MRQYEVYFYSFQARKIVSETVEAYGVTQERSRATFDKGHGCKAVYLFVVKVELVNAP